MHDDPSYDEEEQWVIWNSAYGIVDTVAIKRVEIASGDRNAWLDDPYDMVGPFSLDELETKGQISFAACIVMSRQKWQDEQVSLRRESIKKRRAAQEQFYEDINRYNESRRARASHFHQITEEEHRELLNLPVEGSLESSQIKAAFRLLAKKAHPDVGGNHEHFIQITEARDALLAIFS